MNILITGGCGFIGINLIKALLNRGDARIVVVDNLSVGTREDLASVGKFEEITRDEVGNVLTNRLELVVGDIRDEDLANRVCNGIDAVVHLAANTGVIPSIEDPGADYMANVF